MWEEQCGTLRICVSFASRFEHANIRHLLPEAKSMHSWMLFTIWSRSISEVA